MGPNDLLKELVSSLHEESEALAAGDSELLAAVSQRKSVLLARLAPQLRQIGHGDSPLDRAQLRQAQLINERNAKLLAVQWSAARARSEALLGAARGLTVYDAGGTVASAPRQAAALAAA